MRENPEEPTSAVAGAEFLTGGGNMAAAIRAFDWSSHPLGAIADWPDSLKVIVGLVLNSHFPQAVVWGRRLTMIYNDAFVPILGHKPLALGWRFSEAWREAWTTIGPIASRAFAGEATFIEDFPLKINRHGYDEQAYFTFCYSPVRDETGEVCGFVDTVIETTARVTAERTEKLLNAELAHRLQNTLALLQGIASQTFRSASTMEEGLSKFHEQVAALGRAHALLTQTDWNAAPLPDVIESALTPLGAERGRIGISGPRLRVSARQTLMLALALNELCTNAIKYGALSRGTGRISVWWGISDDVFRWVWTEHDGPVVNARSHRGFGSQLIERVLAHEFHGQVAMSFLSEGLRVELTTPKRNIEIHP
jgi:two-component sensor histidine kinase